MSNGKLTDEELKAIKAKVEQATQVVIDLAAMAKLGPVHIPARDDDNDVVLTDALIGAQRLQAHIHALVMENADLMALLHNERLEGDEADFEDDDLFLPPIKPHAVVKTAIKLGVKKPPPMVIWDEDEDD